jgi:hypothetical protein
VRGSRFPLHLFAEVGHPVFLSAAAMPAIDRRSGGTAESSPAR